MLQDEKKKQRKIWEEAAITKEIARKLVRTSNKTPGGKDSVQTDGQDLKKLWRPI